MAEKSITQISKSVRDQYEKGKAAFQRQNLDYAITFFSSVLEQEPGFYECREALRATQYKKVGSSSGFFKKMLSGASSSPMVAKGQLALRNNPLEALKIAEQILTADPNSTGGHKLLADAAMATELPKTAILSLEILIKANPKDQDVIHELAQAYAAAGETEKAGERYDELIGLR
ncbi:MAG: tetratricopeptide repeat protein, partial [Limisphaerales bacterium]